MYKQYRFQYSAPPKTTSPAERAAKRLAERAAAAAAERAAADEVIQSRKNR